MYNTLFLCTYNLIHNKDVDEDDDELSNDLYRSQLLQAFNLSEWDSGKIVTMFENLSKMLSNNDKGKVILERMKNKSMIPIEDMEIVVLFSYDYFDLFHKCLLDFFTHGRILEETKNNLINKIKND